MEYNGKYRRYSNILSASDIFDDVVPEIVEIDANLNKHVASWALNHDTVFESVKVVPYREPVYLTEFLDSIELHDESLDYIYQVFLNSIEEHWAPDKTHVIGCSSGIDSRLIAKAIKDLTKKNGTEWLGDYLFVENGGEGEMFKIIMKILGFDNYFVWEPHYDFKYFEDIHARFNGISSFPVNQWYDYFAKNFNFDDIQYITGYGANVTEAARLRHSFMKSEGIKQGVVDRLRDFFKWQYYLQMPVFKQVPDTMYPFWNFKYIRAIAGSARNYGTRMSSVLADVKVPECKHVPRMKLTELNREREVDAEVMKELVEWYGSTEHGSRYPVQPSSAIEYHQWWLHFCIASYIESKNIIEIGEPVCAKHILAPEPRINRHVALPDKMKNITIVGNDCGGSHACGLSAGMRRYANVTAVWRNKNKHGLDNIDVRANFGWNNIPPTGDEIIIVSCITYDYLVRDLGERKVKKILSGYKKVKVIVGDGRLARNPKKYNKIFEDFDEVFCHICKIHFRGELPTKIFFQPFDLSSTPIIKNDILTVAHSPFVVKKEREKGTGIIVNAMGHHPDVKFDLISGVPWEEAMRRKAAAHIFVDQVGHYDLDKFKFLDDDYEWPALGKSGIEAMHLGCLVITRGQPEEREIPSPPVAWCTTDNFRDILRYYITHHESREELARKQQMWARKYATHDFAARHVLGYE